LGSSWVLLQWLKSSRLITVRQKMKRAEGRGTSAAWSTEFVFMIPPRTRDGGGYASAEK
jgi:hypothetical protein